jgi:hypothetical protein
MNLPVTNKKPNRPRVTPAAGGAGGTRDARTSGSGSGLRSRAQSAEHNLDDLEPLDAPPPAARLAPELEERIFQLVTAVGEEEGRTVPPSWVAVTDAAKRAGYVRETGLRLYLTQHGRLWLASRASRNAPGQGGGSGTLTYTMTKIDPVARLALKDVARETGVPMQEALGHIVSEIHENRDALTSVARKAGFDHPWEAIRVLLKAAGVKR